MKNFLGGTSATQQVAPANQAHFWLVSLKLQLAYDTIFESQKNVQQITTSTLLEKRKNKIRIKRVHSHKNRESRTSDGDDNEATVMGVCHGHGARPVQGFIPRTHAHHFKPRKRLGPHQRDSVTNNDTVR